MGGNEEFWPIILIFSLVTIAGVVGYIGEGNRDRVAQAIFVAVVLAVSAVLLAYCPMSP
jgi:hypothetical protein